MKTLRTAYRVRDLDRSLDFYGKVGFHEIDRVKIGDGSTLAMLNLPGDGDVVTLELVYDPRIGSLEIGTGFSHVVVQVDDLAATLADLAGKGVSFDGLERPAGEAGPAICNVRDPDGYRIELVEWPPAPPRDRPLRAYAGSPSPRRLAAAYRLQGRGALPCESSKQRTAPFLDAPLPARPTDMVVDQSTRWCA